LYVYTGTLFDTRLQSALMTICKTMANIIVRKMMEAEIRQHRDQLSFEREFIEEIITRMRASTLFDTTNLRYLQTPVETTAGDLLLSAFRPDGSQHVILGDFTGHGLPAAIGGPTVSDIFYSMTKKGLPLREVLSEINTRLLEKMPVRMFMAAGVLELSKDRRRLKIWNCSMPDILIYRNGKLHQRIASGMLARGILNLPDAPGTVLDMLPGDRIFTYTDGFTEEKNMKGIMFGQKNFEQLMGKMLDLDEPLEILQKTLKKYRAGKKQGDDMTMVELTC
jgi:two-component system, HptB-dependent secretion and biofilm response regulator